MHKNNKILILYCLVYFLRKKTLSMNNTCTKNTLFIKPTDHINYSKYAIAFLNTLLNFQYLNGYFMYCLKNLQYYAQFFFLSYAQ